MANDTTGNPWTLDTAGVITTNPVYVKSIRWTPTTAGDDILIQDNGGSNVWKLKSLAADSNQAIENMIEIDGMVNGFNLVTLDNGTVYVHIK